MSSLSGAHFSADGLPAETTAPADAQLMNLARAGDRGAFGQIVVRYQDRLFTAVLRMVGDHDDARELTQEAFTRALMNLESFRGDAQPYTWLFRIAMNLAISRLRKTARKKTFSIDAPGGGNGRNGSADQASGLLDRVSHQRSEAPDEIAERRERQQQVVAALGRLDTEYRAILVMRDIEGFDYQQMAEVLELPLGTLKSRLFRARLALRDELASYMK